MIHSRTVGATANPFQRYSPVSRLQVTIAVHSLRDSLHPYRNASYTGSYVMPQEHT